MSLTFWAFLCQVLSPGSGCREIVRKIQFWHRARKRAMPSSRTGAYCQARQRLPLQRLTQAHEALADRVAADAVTEGTWKGHRLRVIDGTGLSMPDTPSNQKAYPQPKEQAPGCGFPVVKLVAIFCLQTGALIRWVQGTLHEHENRMLKGLLDLFAPSDIVVADRGFSGFAQFATFIQREVELLTRLHQRRRMDWRQGTRLGPRDRIISWQRPYRQNDIFTAQEWDALPEEIFVRAVEVKVEIRGFRTESFVLVTTLMDSEAYPADELARLYLRRWSVEVFYRDIKQSTGMDILRCKSAAMIDKEIHLHVIAYNLIRALMSDIAQRHQVDVQRISFKGTLDALRQWQPLWDQPNGRSKTDARDRDALYEIIAHDLLLIRPNRSEPRPVKRRPKNFRLMTKPRDQMVVERCRKQS